jgi:hypothetical protein
MMYTIYQTTNTLNGKTYVGKHQTDEPYDTYMGSGIAIYRAISKYGRENFTKRVLYTFEFEWQMNLAERILVVPDYELSYNLGPGGEGGPHFRGRKHSDLTVQKIKETRKQRGHDVKVFKPKPVKIKVIVPRGADHILSKTRHPVKGEKLSSEWKENIRTSMTGKHRSEETKAKLSAAFKGRVPWNKGLKFNAEKSTGS